MPLYLANLIAALIKTAGSLPMAQTDFQISVPKITVSTIRSKGAVVA